MKRKSSHLLLVGIGLIVQPFVLTVLASGATQQQVSQWRLKSIPHGVTYERTAFPKEYTVHKLDSKGGDIEVRKWQKSSPACFQTLRYRWTFGRDVPQICQDDEVPVDVSVRIVDENVCGDVRHWNRYISFFGANGGASAPSSKLLGQLSHQSRYLTRGESKRVYARKGAAHWKGVPIGSGRGTLSVTDRTSIGVEMNAPDGYFWLSLNGEYAVIYKYIEDARGCGAPMDESSTQTVKTLPVDDLSSTWIGHYH